MGHFRRTGERWRHRVQVSYVRRVQSKYGSKHTTSSPHHHQTNGSAESGVRISNWILEQEDPFLASMAYCIIPVPATSKTPLELIMGRQLWTTIPRMSKVIEPKLPDHAAVNKADVKAKRGYKESFYRRNGKRAPATSTKRLSKSQAG